MVLLRVTVAGTGDIHAELRTLVRTWTVRVWVQTIGVWVQTVGVWVQTVGIFDLIVGVWVLTVGVWRRGCGLRAVAIER